MLSKPPSQMLNSWHRGSQCLPPWIHHEALHEEPQLMANEETGEHGGHMCNHTLQHKRGSQG